jgi:EAL domain-containing protein (putative c-di-GMP-specific phosphodiesterase class I)
MLRQNWTIIAATMLFVIAAIGSGLYMYFGGSAPVLGAATAVVALAFGQCVSLVHALQLERDFKQSHKTLASDIIEVSRTNSDAKRHSDYLLAQLSEIRGEVTENSAAVAAGFADLKSTYASLAQELQNSITSARSYYTPTPPQPIITANASPKIEPPIQVASPFGEKLLVSLEPIVDLHTGSTAHYRVHLGMLSASGEELTHELLLHHADRMGVRPQLDMFVAREAEILLRRLRQRDPLLNIFVPIGAATLSSPTTLAQIVVDRQTAADVAAGVAFELPHAMLAGLTDYALEGLAMLARQGAVLALTNVSVVGLDLNAMGTLNVRFVGLDVSAIDMANGPSAAMIGFAQAARASRVQMIVTGVTYPRVVASLPQITRLASGPCFAVPRRVKREMADETVAHFNAAA